MNFYFPKTVALGSGVSLQIFAQKSSKDSKVKRNCAFIGATKEKTASVAVFATQKRTLWSYSNLNI
jgi:hypothetical protein